MTEDIMITATRHTHPKNITTNMKQFEGKVVVITGENICIDGGMTHQMIYHAEHGWTLNS